jgi:hypothetical protein
MDLRDCYHSFLMHLRRIFRGYLIDNYDGLVVADFIACGQIVAHL